MLGLMFSLPVCNLNQAPHTIAGERLRYEFPLRCLFIGLFMRVFLTCHISCHICDETLLPAPPKHISLFFVKCALAVCSAQCMQKFLIKHSNEQGYQQQARCFINTQDGEANQALTSEGRAK